MTLTPFVAVRPGRTTSPGSAREPTELDPVAAPRATSLGPLLAPHARDEGVTDLLLDGAGALWIDAGAGLVRAVGWSPLDATDARRLATSLVAGGGRHLDDASPCVDVRLDGGLRVHAVLPPVTTGGTALSIRLARQAPWRLEDLRAAGAIDDAMAARLRAAMVAQHNLLICGPAGSGKTALLAALLAEAPPTERIVTIEDVAELAIDHPHVIALETRQPNADGAGAIGITRLVREALRMRPDRLVVGECRGAEVADLLAALNTGHDGGAATVHSTTLADVPARLEALGALAGLSVDALARQARSAIDLVVQLGRIDGVRRVVGVGRFVGSNRLEIEPVP
jgi:pilus assembly protein CpaF